LGAAHGGAFGNDARAATGKMMNSAYGLFTGNQVPQDINSVLSPEAQQASVSKVRDAMNATGENGQRGGWAAGRAAMQPQLDQAKSILSLPPDVAITSLMGMGAKTPEEAKSMLEQISSRYQEASNPEYLRNQARAEVMAQLEAADKKNFGQLSDYFTDKANGVSQPLREMAIRAALQNNPEYAQFLKRDENGNILLPEGNTMQQFADSMLTNAYGEYEKSGMARAVKQWWAEKLIKQAINDVDAKELNDLKEQKSEGVSYRVEDARRLNELERRQQSEAQPAVKRQVTIAVCQKAARCWAGYEPVPGAKPFSRGSCRPKGSKKTQKEMKKT
jgi:hypothetical protein